MTLRFVVLACAALATSAFAMQRGAPPDVAADPFKGVTADGKVTPGLFVIRSTGVSTKPVMQAAIASIAALTPEQRQSTTFQ